MRKRRGLALIVCVALALAGCEQVKDSRSSQISPSVAIEPSGAITSSISPSAEPSLPPSIAPSAGPTPPSAVAQLDGMLADPAAASRLPLAVMIDDAVAARPQAGFNAASIVYQAPADGGEDRYMLVFQEGVSDLIGPVRSGRPYFIRWAAEYRSAFGHYGGDVKTLAHIPSIDGTLIYDLDALRNAASAYHRDRSRVAPHNAYTSTDALTRVGRRLGIPAAMVTGLPARVFADDAPLEARPSGGSITVPYGRGSTSYRYDRAANRYLRFVAGKQQIDAGDGQTVTARNVIVLFMRLSYDLKSEPGHRRPVLDQIGTGKAIVFRDGKAFTGRWQKSNEGALTRFVDAQGNDISLVRGRIFIQVVATGTNVTFKTS
jgi:hypothetical protein